MKSSSEDISPQVTENNEMEIDVEKKTNEDNFQQKTEHYQKNITSTPWLRHVNDELLRRHEATNALLDRKKAKAKGENIL